MSKWHSCAADCLIFGALLALVVGAFAVTAEVFAQIEGEGDKGQGEGYREQVTGDRGDSVNNNDNYLSDQPEMAGDILSPEEDLGKLVVSPAYPPLEDEPWHLWLMGHLHEPGLADAVQAAQIATDIDGAAILATLWHECRLRHTFADGSTRLGDRRVRPDGKVVWLAIGVGQVHRSPWEKHFSDELGYKLSLDDLSDNVLVCALIIKRGGWEKSDGTSKQMAYSYYNTGKRGIVTRYGQKVHGTQVEIEWQSIVTPDTGKLIEVDIDAEPGQRINVVDGGK